MLQRNVDGVAVMTFGIEEELVQKLVEREFPLVFVDAGPDLPNIRVLKVNYAEGIRQGVQHLAALGHRAHRLHQRAPCPALRRPLAAMRLSDPWPSWDSQYRRST